MLLSVVLVACASYVAQAQNARQLSLVAGDTVSNTGTVTKYIPVTAGYSVVAMQPVLTKIDGTVAGKIYLVARLDGTNWVRIDSVTSLNTAINTTLFTRGAPGGTQYGIQAVGSGTMNAQLKVWYVVKKHD